MNFFRRKERRTDAAVESQSTAPDREADEGINEMSEPPATTTQQTEPTTQAVLDAAPASLPDAASAPTPAPDAPPGAPASTGVARVRDDVIAVLKTVYDPEIPVDIYELGLIYEVDVQANGDVSVIMTLTTPMCPVAETLPPEVEAKVRDVPGVHHVQLELVWEPPWTMDMMSEAARLELNL